MWVAIPLEAEVQLHRNIAATVLRLNHNQVGKMPITSRPDSIHPHRSLIWCNNGRTGRLTLMISSISKASAER